MFEDLQASLYHHKGMVSDLLQPQPFCDCVILCNILKITYKKLYLQLISTEHKIMLKIFLIVILEMGEIKFDSHAYVSLFRQPGKNSRTKF